MAHEVETMFSARETPWHGLGQVTEDVLTAKDAIVAAGLDWEVELRKVYTLNTAGNKMVVPGNHAVVRDSDESVLGIVKSKYVPFQNRDAFTFADNLVDSGSAKYETAGSLRGGKQVFLTMKVPTEIKINGGDAHDLYVLLRTSHDGSKAVGVYLTPIRVVCMNTMALATQRSNVKQKWSMPHVSTIEGKLNEARETLKMSFEYADEFSRMANELIDVKITDDEAFRLLSEVFPVRPKTDEKIDGVLDCLRESDKNGYRGTGWGLLNAMTEYHEHYRERIQPEATFFNTIDGEIAKWRNQLTSRLLTV